jgi:predicted lipid-binding transport protein (Tim44 family)
MRHFISFLLITLFMFSFTHEAYAKRFGGGKSFGAQRSQQSTSSAAASDKAKSTPQQNAAPSRGLGGMLGGLLVGGLLASLLMSNGLGAGLFTWLILGAVVFFLIQFFRKKMQPHFQTTPAQPIPQNNLNNISSLYPQETANVKNNSFSSLNFTTKFEQEPFLRAAKVLFIRLQSAYDQKNMQDLAEFSAPNVFAEIKMQLEERGAESNVTEVISLEAKLLNVSEQADETTASVRFIGQIKENNQSQELDEVWYFRQYAPNDNWTVVGIEQSAVSELVQD